MQQETLTLFDEDKNEGYLVAEVLNIFFEAPASLYKVALVGITETDLDLDSEVTITGNFPELIEGTSYYFKERSRNILNMGAKFKCSVISQRSCPQKMV